MDALLTLPTVEIPAVNQHSRTLTPQNPAFFHAFSPFVPCVPRKHWLIVQCGPHFRAAEGENRAAGLEIYFDAD